MNAKAAPGPMKMVSDAMRQYLPYMNLGYQLVALVGGGFGLGWWIDGKAGTSPLLAVAGAMLGVGAGIFLTVRAVTDLSRTEPKNTDKK